MAKPKDKGKIVELVYDENYKVIGYKIKGKKTWVLAINTWFSRDGKLPAKEMEVYVKFRKEKQIYNVWPVPHNKLRRR